MVPPQVASAIETTVTAEQIYAPVTADLVKVQKSLEEIVPPETELLAMSIAHSMQAQGKFLRPVLTLLASGASGGLEMAHVETAAVAELIHVATLLHDDVLDDADLRRGRPTVRAHWGNKVAILSGDYLLAQASLKLSRLNLCRLVSIFAIVLSNLCEGEVEQIRSSYNLETTWNSYFKKTICKTASLFAACCESAGVINQLPEPQIKSLRSFGEKFGIAFQIIDDLLDYTSSAKQLGKPVLDDLKNGILNAPVLLALESFPQGSTEGRRLEYLLEQLFANPGENAKPQEEYKQELFSLFTQVNAVERTQELAERYAAEAREAIMFLPETTYRQALLDLTRYATQREH
jgi:all-trans-nonaprenyl-diphosphate synthase